MKFKKNSIILLSLSVVFSINSAFAQNTQNAQVITNPQTNSTQLVIPINPNIALQAPWIMNNMRNLEQLNKKPVVTPEPKVEKPAKVEEVVKVEEKPDVATKTDVETKIVPTQVAKPMGQIPLDNQIIVTNDIRLWNSTSINEMTEKGQKQTMDSYHNK